jgi:SAM-dependent methyltransferase
VHEQFLDLLVDPETGADLALEAETWRGDLVETGALVSDTNRFPIIGGIPRFVPLGGNYSDSFGYQWNRGKWSRVQFESENAGRPMEGHTRRMWERIVGFDAGGADVKGKVIADIGCGPGRFVDVARAQGAKVIGIDYSRAVEAARANFPGDPDVCICQADALKPPIRAGAVDGAFSVGVLEHTPDPGKGVEMAFRMLRDGGWFALTVYTAGPYFGKRNLRFVRRVMRRLWPMFGPYPALAYTYMTVIPLRPIDRRLPRLAAVLGTLLPHISLPDVNWSLLDTFDRITPAYQSAHTPHEVFQWFKAAGFREIEPTDWGFTSMHGRK